MDMKKLMRKSAILPAVVTMLVIVNSCIDGLLGDGGTLPPPAIALQITVENKGDVPVTVRLRHAYSGEWKDGKREYTDWAAIELAGGESRTINNETVRYVYKGKTQEMSGFILFDESLFNEMNMQHDEDSSSFELEITAAAKTTRFAGYDTEDGAFTETGLGDLKMMLEIWGMETVLYYKGRGQDEKFFIIIPYVLDASLIIEANGTCTFEYKNIYESGNTYFPD